ncbi:ATPase family AAA domain-containing protein 5b isoform X2 [Pseudoliparis swirei]|uniref:ATPase family AAA domain-containing protein 5b isoform X2 n=1 Tax=Pseudoliparis swirei TaxID=2059687 RepID=UPI0024BE8B0F|nr:ATPase family AAA domain-containing protein 5b isoform X2 [Pseudoliparis swirei]
MRQRATRQRTESLNVDFLAMQNKLKRSKKCKDVLPTRTSEGVTFIGASLAAEDAHAAAAGAASTRKVAPPPERRDTFCGKHVQIAPIFLCKTQHSESKWSGDGASGRPVEKQTEDVQRVKGQRCLSTVSRPTEGRGSGGGRLSSSALRRCLEDIQASNPAFPVSTVFSTLRERAQDSGPTAIHISSPQNPLQEKRERGNESSERGPKRLRSSLSAEEAFGVGPRLVSAVQEGPVLVVKKLQPRSNKLSRARRLREQSGSPVDPEPLSGLINPAESRSQSPKPSGIHQRDSSFEDVLWTDKYSPRHSSEVIGNSAPVKKLQIWLKKWKRRADRDESRREENRNDSWDCGDFQGEAGPEEGLCNTVLITGPSGVGKTASVYACAQELGFKVFEVNCSSQRNGRQVLSQLKEATQSHLVEMSGKDPLKPTYFNNYAINSCTLKSETLPGKAVRPKNVTSTSKNRAAQKFGHSSRKGKLRPAAVTLANYFRVKAKADHIHAKSPSPSHKPDGEGSGNQSPPGSDPMAPKNRKTATSLILFEEVDVIFDDDVGFLAAVKTFMTTTKRPVVLTTTDPSFRERFSCSLEEIVFKTPSAANIVSYLQLVGLAESVRLELDDVSSLVRLSRGDARRCLLQLQLWVNSGGGRSSLSGGSPEEATVRIYSSDTERGDYEDSQRPRCDAGCTASMLGFHHVTQHQLYNLLKRPVWTEIETNKLLRLLAESWRGGVPLLYCNLELLLPIGGPEGTCPGLQRKPAPSDIDPHVRQVTGKAPATHSRSIKASRLGRRKWIPATLDATSLMRHPQRASSSPQRAARSRDETEASRAEAATGGLDALADFFDLVSYLDYTTPAAAAPLISGPFVWTGAGIKDGSLDEMREDVEEAGRTFSQERILDIQAAVEGLGCHRCCWRMSVALTEAQQYRRELGDARWGRLTEELAASSKGQSLTFSAPLLWAPRSSFSLLGNRRAVAVDYMPVLRHMCRLQRAQEQKEEPVRSLNYLSITQLGLSKSTIKLLAEDFS